MKIASLLQILDEWAPPSLQESYDNSGLITGQPNAAVSGILISLDCTEAVVEEAIATNCNVIISHHPIVFSGLKKLTGSNYVERTVIKAIKNDIALIAIHTNLDNVASGVNHEIAQRIGIEQCKPLQIKSNTLLKLDTYVPNDALEVVRSALFEAGAGKIGNYDSCSFSLQGEGSFRALEGSKPNRGKQDTLHFEPEVNLSCVFHQHNRRAVIAALKKSHPYETPAFDILHLENSDETIGSGRIGTLPSPMPTSEFLLHLKDTMELKVIRHTPLVKDSIQKVAICGGSGSFLIKSARQQQADIFITGDVKYHEFFDAEQDLIIADIGHYESERFTTQLIGAYLNEKMPTFAIRFSEVNTNPVNYYV